MNDFIQKEIPPGDNPRLDLLNEMAQGSPWLFLIAIADNQLTLSLEVGGGIRDLNTIWCALDKAKRSIEIEMLERGEVPTYESFSDDDS